MKLEYGPPGAIGVKHLQYMSADEPDYLAGNLRQLARPVGTIAMATWAYAWATGREDLRRTAFGVALGSFLVGLLSR